MLKKLFQNRNSADSKEFICSYDNRDKYIIRTKPWDWLNEKEIYVTDKVDGSPKMLTFGFWSQEIYLDANGQIAVTELINLVRKQYHDSNLTPPPNWDKDIIEALESLVFSLKIVDFKDAKTKLTKELELPLSGR